MPSFKKSRPVCQVNLPQGYSIEVFNAVGETIAVISVPANALEPLREDEVLSVRPLAKVG
jgi:hypothetical protein